MDERRLDLNDKPRKQGPVLYWMSREQRAFDNWGLLAAAAEAREMRAPLYVVFALAPSFLGATWRQYDFLLRGLRETERQLRDRRIPLLIRTGEPPDSVGALARELSAGSVFTDFDPLRPKTAWRKALAASLPVRLTEVDGHNIVPCRVASQKREYAARTLRPKLHSLLPERLTDIPALETHPFPPADFPAPQDFDALERRITADRSVSPVPGFPPGYSAGMERLRSFLEEKLDRYPEDRNDPCRDALSGLSPYLHFGQISAQRVAFEASRTVSPGAGAFLEELIVRRELADNFCLHAPSYDTPDAWPDWGRKTLERHSGDHREYIYPKETLEAAETHDPLWNAAQREMTERGKMHGWLRMYWVKKLLEWTETPEEALALAIAMNDRYELDGRDPNGYAGIAWGLAGLHDRPWGERPVFGLVRTMTFDGAKRKFDLRRYLESASRNKRSK